MRFAWPLTIQWKWGRGGKLFLFLCLSVECEPLEHPSDISHMSCIFLNPIPQQNRAYIPVYRKCEFCHPPRTHFLPLRIKYSRDRDNDHRCIFHFRLFLFYMFHILARLRPIYPLCRSLQSWIDHWRSDFERRCRSCPCSLRDKMSESVFPEMRWWGYESWICHPQKMTTISFL